MHALHHVHFPVPCLSERGTEPYMGTCIVKEVYITNSLYPKPAQHRAFLLGQELVRLGIPDVHVNPVDDPKEFVHVGSH